MSLAFLRWEDKAYDGEIIFERSSHTLNLGRIQVLVISNLARRKGVKLCEK